MRKVDEISKVSRIDIINDLILIGIDSKAAEGVMASNGDVLSVFQEGERIADYQLKFFYFLSFSQGVIYYEKEGDPICYFDFERTKKVTDANTYFNPLQSRVDKDICVVSEMDNDFNQTFKLLDDCFVARELPQFPKILLNDSFIFFNRSIVEKYSISNFELKWKLEIDPLNQVERRNQGHAVFSDGEYVFIRLKDAKLQCVSLLEGKKLWELENDIEQVSFSESRDSLYIHLGDGFSEVNKSSGEITRSVRYREINRLDGYSSNGIIWIFEDVIITRNSFTGDLAIFNLGTFELIDREIVDPAGIPEAKDCIRLVNNYLYVLSTSSRLHIYKI